MFACSWVLMSKDILSLPTVFNYNLWLNLLLGGILLKDPQDGICGLTETILE